MSIRATTYLQIEPEYGYWDKEKVTGAKVIRATQRSPGDRQLGGTVLVKITVDLPEAAFKPLQPQAVVVIPEGLVDGFVVTAQAEDPRPEEPD